MNTKLLRFQLLNDSFTRFTLSRIPTMKAFASFFLVVLLIHFVAAQYNYERPKGQKQGK